MVSTFYGGLRRLTMAALGSIYGPPCVIPHCSEKRLKLRFVNERYLHFYSPDGSVLSTSDINNNAATRNRRRFEISTDSTETEQQINYLKMIVEPVNNGHLGLYLYRQRLTDFCIAHSDRLGLAIVPLCRGTGAPLRRTQAPPVPFEFF